jgi:hypothetical protein
VRRLLQQIVNDHIKPKSKGGNGTSEMGRYCVELVIVRKAIRKSKVWDIFYIKRMNKKKKIIFEYKNSNGEYELESAWADMEVN